MRILTPLRCRRALAALLVGSAAGTVHAQEVAGAAADTVGLGELHAAALREDPREAQLGLVEARTRARLRASAADRLPNVDLQARGQYQSDVPSIPFDLPGGAAAPVPPHDTYDASLSVRQSLYDPALTARRRVESARGEEASSEVATALYSLKEQVNEAFFRVLQLRTRADEVEAAAAAILGHLEVVAARVVERTALAGEEALLRREWLRQRQAIAQIVAQEAAMRGVLELLTGVSIGPETELRSPELGDEVEALRADSPYLRSRPEYERFDRARELLDRQGEALLARRRPRVSAFGRGGYGRPGLNPLATELDTYWLAGLQVEWAPWQRGAVHAERQELALERRIVDTREAAFTRELESALIVETATIAELEGTVQRDEEIVALSEQIAAETRLRFSEGVVTSAEVLEDETDLLRARLDRTAHRIALARARARLLTITGEELP